MKESKSIKDISWAGGLLYVTFHTGSTYEYIDVPEETYKEFLAAESLGKYFAKNIRGKFEEGKIPKDGEIQWPFPGGKPLTSEEKKIKGGTAALPRPWKLNKPHGADVAAAWPFPVGSKPVEGPKDSALQSEDYTRFLEWTEEEEQAFLDMVDGPKEDNADGESK